MPNLLIALNYYSPYVSGLTNVARDVAEGLVERGWNVTVVASQHQENLMREEWINGVRVLRAPILARVGKGVISFDFFRIFRQESLKADVINLHVPMLEAGVLAKISTSPVVTTYQCDVSLPSSVFGSIQNAAVDYSARMAIKNSYSVTVTSDDYADHSRLSKSLQMNRRVIPATCYLREKGSPTFRDGSGMHVGFLGRIVEEKGIEYLVDGFRALPDPDARLLIAGEFLDIAGGSVIERVRRRINDDSRIKLLGFISDEDLGDFYGSLDVFALPSINPFEAFGIVQVEAMMMGIPVIASDLPGVRQPVLKTGMGEVVARRSATAITEALLRLNSNRGNSTEVGSNTARALYSISATLDKFEDVFNEAMQSNGRQCH
ncbi:glycosyltransferase family 4 protein [Comamonas sediminis]|uniref:glycosyltransferase family 4 protein n=1 Tax=Comamonas sediminis TaxID=1783360 RepID=UPI003D2E1D1D